MGPTKRSSRHAIIACATALQIVAISGFMPSTFAAAPTSTNIPDKKPRTASGTFVSFKDGTLTLKHRSDVLTYEQVGAQYKTYENNEDGPGSKLVDTVAALNRVLPGAVVDVNVEDREISFGFDHRVIGNFVSYENGKLTLLAADVAPGFIARPTGTVAVEIEPGIPVLESIEGGDYAYTGPAIDALKTVQKGTLLTARSEYDADTIEVIQIGEPKRKMERYVGQTRGTLRGTFVSFKDGVLRILGKGMNSLATSEYERLLSLRIADTISIAESIDGGDYQPAAGVASLKAVKEGTIVTVRRVEGVILGIQIGIARQPQLTPAKTPAK